MLLKSLLALTALLCVVTAIPRPPIDEDSIIPVSDNEMISTFRDDVDGKDYRLPNNTIPINYNIQLETNVHKGDFAFTGKVRIHIKVVEASKTITLQTRQVTLINIRIMSSDMTVLTEKATYKETIDTEFLIINTPDLVVNQEVYVEIDYTATLRDDEAGFYRSSYKNLAGQTVWLGVTQFEQTDARHAFPCFDEPGIRATFDVQIKHDKSYNAVSNTKSKGRVTVPGTDYVTTSFERTLPMQTYLVAFLVSDFTYVENNDETLRHRVYAKKQSIDAGDAAYALENGEIVLRKMEAHFGVSYSYTKMDQVAVPDFAAGAMENWGLVTYRETGQLWNNVTNTRRQKEGILTVIAHEFAHQFFGNLVSPAWWSYLWLNEGFATIYANYLADLCYPEERLMDTFVVGTVQAVFETDASPNIRPMTYYVESSDRIGQLFDNIAYSKSGSVLRMMQNALTVNTWTKGIRYYLLTKGLTSATPSDLYAGIQKSVDEDFKTSAPNVAAIMGTWEHQSGHPLVTVTRNGDKITLTQERMLYKGTDTANSLWWIPINYVVGSNANFTSTAPDMWMQGEKNVTLTSATAPKPWTANDWIIFNSQQTSYYRVNYDNGLWMSIIQQLNKAGDEYAKINVVNRAQLIDDSLSMARAGRVKYSIPLGIMNYLSKETDYIPWVPANKGLSVMNRMLCGTPSYDHYQNFVRKMSSAMYSKLGADLIPNEPKLDVYGRQLIIDLACQSGSLTCLTQTNAKLNQLMKTPEMKIVPDVRSQIYCNGLRTANSDLFFFMFNRIQTTTDASERALLITSLGCIGDAVLLKMHLNSGISKGDYTNNERARVLSSGVSNGLMGLEVTMRFVSANYVAINKNIPNYVLTMISYIANCVTTPQLMQQFTNLMEMLVEAGYMTQNSVANYQATAQNNLNWLAANIVEIDAVIKDGTIPTPTVVPTSVPTTNSPPTSSQLPTTTGGAQTIVISSIVLLSSIAMKIFI